MNNRALRTLDSALAVQSAQEVNSNHVTDKVSSAEQTVNALSSVLNYIATDAFNLNPEESMWVGHHLAQMLAPLREMEPKFVLAAVNREMKTGHYSEHMLDLLRNGEVSGHPYQQVEDDEIRYATLHEWTESLASVVLECYPEIRPMIRASIVGSLYGMLEELGLSNNVKQSRASLYLPIAVRHIANSNRQD